MSLAAGIRIGPYEIVSALGAGGIGEVYRARDTRLGREAAIKVLPAAAASDSERVARFTRQGSGCRTVSGPIGWAGAKTTCETDRNFMFL